MQKPEDPARSEHDVKTLGHLGDGVADGPVFVPLSLPGERVSGVLNGTRLEEVRIERPSDLRVSAPCPHFRRCGGCALQHARSDFVADWKAAIVRDALKSVGLEPEIRPTLTSEARSRRRATFAATRTRKGATAGFHVRGSEQIVAVPECHLLTPALVEALPVIEAIARHGGSRKATLDATVTETLGGLDVLIVGGKPLDTALRQTLAQLAEDAGLARLTWDGETVVLRAPPEIEVAGIRVMPPPGAFLQATEHGQESLIQLVKGIVGSAPRVVDLFAGCGTFSLPLARGAEVLAVEGEAPMLKALDHGWRHAQGLKQVRTAARDLFRNPLLPDELARFDAVVIDPPRAGAEAQIAQIAKARMPVVAHVSCNPQTFARDAKTLVDAGYALTWVQPVDQFRWSTHVELVGAFTAT